MIAPNEDTLGSETPPIIWPDDLRDSLVTGLTDALWMSMRKFADHHKLSYSDDILVNGLQEITESLKLKSFIWKELDENFANFLLLRDSQSWDEAKKLACYLSLGAILEVMEPNKFEVAKTLLAIKQQKDKENDNKTS